MIEFPASSGKVQREASQISPPPAPMLESADAAAADAPLLLLPLPPMLLPALVGLNSPGATSNPANSSNLLHSFCDRTLREKFAQIQAHRLSRIGSRSIDCPSIYLGSPWPSGQNRRAKNEIHSALIAGFSPNFWAPSCSSNQ